MAGTASGRSAEACYAGGCRDMEGVEPYPGDPWATREFHVKWKRWSYIHCSWDTRETLSQLGGYKRLVNYMKRIDEQQARRRHPLPSHTLSILLGLWMGGQAP